MSADPNQVIGGVVEGRRYDASFDMDEVMSFGLRIAGLAGLIAGQGAGRQAAPPASQGRANGQPIGNAGSPPVPAAKKTGSGSDITGTR